MRAVIQRVKEATVTIDDRLTSKINNGLLVFVGIADEDNDADVEWLACKIVQLRIFNDTNGVMNLSVMDTGGSIMVISQFTLHARTKKGNRPSYIRAAKHEIAIPLYNKFVERLTQLTGKKTATGEFGAMMDIGLVNDGPVTILIDTKEKE
ncbi:MAG: D-aminoacyl-tRNA deacylase [Bacteroidales bacterium]|jgi:D-tyrosyl-tRNA(Tyr) deacylase